MSLAIGEACMLWLYVKQTYQGYHYYDVPTLTDQERVLGSKYDLANQLLYNPILALVKASVLIFLWRLEDRRKIIQWSIKGLFALNLCLLISQFFVVMFQCSPMNYYWDHWTMDEYGPPDPETGIPPVTVPGGTCIDQVKFYLISPGLAVLTDILILLIPAAMVWNLRMPRKKKIAVWAVLSLGWIVAIIGLVRLVLYYFRFRPDYRDRSHSLTLTTSGMEVSIAIIASCGPAIKALMTRFMPNLFNSTQTNSARGTSSGNVFYSPQAYARGRSPGFGTKTDSRPQDSHYGLRDLGPDGRETDGDSQEAIVRTESLAMKRDDFDFGLEDAQVAEPRKVFWHRPSE
ncbi:uncharacterized protein LTR77_008328 [Saxophila tyrrhenica]|uniref:Rhodopsin domain-containing protein n=1 Tax=Saxophila tyrrhenica TaxID=1690608 RepID=A0AAV9P3X9_9PEZI|nr:hypothetical protein LTR77_008328 [Saxophila tyrrhenica]